MALALDFDRRPWIAIGGLILAALVAQLSAYLGGVHGEQDGARLVVDALAWLKAGVRNEALSEYRYYTSPGYIAVVIGAVQAGRIVNIHPVQLLGAINLLLAVAIVIPTYRLAARLTNASTALIAGLIMVCMPMVWHAGSYGFPHLPAVFCLLCAYLVYDRHLTGPPWLGPRADLAAVLLLLAACVLLKADAYAGALGLPALLLVRKRLTAGRLAVAAVILALPLLVAATTAQLLLQASPSVGEYIESYQEQYPVAWWHLTSRWHVEGWLMAFGFYTAPVAALGLLAGLVTGRWTLAVLIALWAGPVAFWILSPGDSDRHHLPEAFPVALGAAMALSQLANKRWVPYVGLAVLLGANVVRYPASIDNLRMSGRVPQSAALIRDRMTQFHRLADAYAASPEPRKVLLGAIANPFVDSEVLLRAERVVSVQQRALLGFAAIQISSVSSGQPQFSASVRVNADQAVAAAQLFREHGYTPYSIEYDLATGERTPPPRRLHTVTVD